MDAAQKEAMAQGRKDARAVGAYLEWLEANKPKRGRRRTKESIGKRLEVIASELDSSSAIARLNLLQEQMDLEAELEAMDQAVDGTDLRIGFVQAAARYSASKGISRAAFRQMGVDAKTLTEAGVK